MEARCIADRSLLLTLWLQHPDWTNRTLAQATGRSRAWVKKWKARFRAASHPGPCAVLYYLPRTASGLLLGRMVYRRPLEDRHGPRRGFAHRDRDEVLVQLADQPVLPQQLDDVVGQLEPLAVQLELLAI